MMTWSTVDALDALNGRLLWRYDTGGDTVDSSPAVVGPPGGQVVAFGTLGGAVDVVSLASGAPLYSYQTGSFISASPADSDGNLVIDSGDGFLYDFGLGGGNATAPTTTVTAPANGSTVAYPSGPLSVTGTATAPHGVKAVTVEVQEGGTSGPWYEAATNSFTPGLGSADATLGYPGRRRQRGPSRHRYPSRGRRSWSRPPRSTRTASRTFRAVRVTTSRPWRASRSQRARPPRW